MHVPSTLCAGVLLLGAANAQDFIHYKFDSNCTTEVVNYATGASALASNGVLQTNSASQFAPGKFGRALEGGTASTYNRVITGWDPGTQNVTGSLTMAWFMKERTAPGSTLSYIMGAPSGGFRLFTGGIAVRGLYQRVILVSGGNGINSTPQQDFYLPAANADIQSLAAAGWVHVAMVVDATAMTADWYVNGTSVLRLNNVPGALINAPGPFQVGFYSNASYYDIDEFFMSFRAYLPAEIMAMSLAPRAGDGTYSSGIAGQCGTGSLGSAGGRPVVPNALYRLTLNTAAVGPYALLVGTTRCSSGNLTLPFDLSPLGPFASGCWLLSDSLATFAGVTSGAPVTIPMPVPSLSGLAGLDLYSQALVLNAAANTLVATRGWAIGLGF
jgi:hypothetical protein